MTARLLGLRINKSTATLHYDAPELMVRSDWQEGGAQTSGLFNRMRVLGALIFGALAQESTSSESWSDWTEWSACEKGVYKRIRRCHDIQEGRAFNRVANDVCGGHYQVTKYK